MGTETSGFGVSKRESHDSSKFYARKLWEVEIDKDTKPQAPNPQSVDALFAKSSTVMAEVADNSVALMVTSPPYHVGKAYDGDESFDEFISEVITPTLAETYRVLEPGGRAAINVAGLGRTPYIPFSHLIDQIMIELGFLPRGEIIWQKAEGASGSCAWGSWLSASNPSLRDIHEKVLVYSKGRFDRHPDSRGAKRPEADRDDFMRDTLSIWKIAPASAKRIGHPAPFPVELPKRLISLYTYEGELVLDPFIGAGSTALAAQELGRHYVGYDIVPEYIELCRTRLRAK